MRNTTFILRLKDLNDGTYSVAAIDLPLTTTLQAATEIILGELRPGMLLERLTNSDTKDSIQLVIKEIQS